MPIKGLTDRGLSFPEIGRIRKGAPKTQANRPGADLGQYFRVDFAEGEEAAADTFVSVYGEQPKQIRVILPFDEIERCWDAYLEAYVRSRMIAQSDGEIYLYRIDGDTGEILVKNGLDVRTGRPVPYNEGDVVYTWTSKQGKVFPLQCKPTGRLKVIVPELARAAYLTLITSSKWDVIHLSEQLAALKELNQGVIKGIPLVLKRRPKELSARNPDGSAIRVKKYLISVEADPSWVRAKVSNLRHLALPDNGMEDDYVIEAPARELLEEPEEEEYDEGYQEDFFGNEQIEEPEEEPEPIVVSNPMGI